MQMVCPLVYVPAALLKLPAGHWAFTRWAKKTAVFIANTAKILGVRKQSFICTEVLGCLPIRQSGARLKKRSI